ncbi:DUF2946 family protein [Sphingobium ummariense]|uniref:DUF2946 domain-containing protein n=1 Tax=Sphingobium ummariense RL-3 TaxID=1346791 RepID=T0K5A1_9SPHN|nr:DUF2946 family protein [Sphingobium ummariense]EQB31849.1 hypothetical protein M529_12470 [Sphingobium ummariense RL-3]
MTGAIRRSEGARGLLAALALLVLALQIVMPSGFMPMRTAKGVVVTLCTGKGAMNVVVDRDQAPHGRMKQDRLPDDGTAPQQHCPYAGGATQPSVPPLALAEVALPGWQLAFGPIAFALRTGFIARLAAPPPPSSGPPAAF